MTEEEALVEKYRPKTLDEVVGQDHIIESLKAKKSLNHMTLSGPPGTGKTTVAYLLAQKYNLHLEVFNASDDRGIGVVRKEIKRFSQTKGRRIILLDEADSLTKDAQNALRGIIEKSKNAIFILTANNGWKIIEALKSRCPVYDFNRLSDTVIANRLWEICEAEKITLEVEKESFKGLLDFINGDMRKAINTLVKLVDKDNKITEKTIRSFQKPKIASQALKVALGGDFERAKNLIEDAFIANRMGIDQIIKELFEAIGEVKELNIKVKLYSKISETAKACSIASDSILPLVNLVGLIAYAFLVPHLSSSCPVLQGK